MQNLSSHTTSYKRVIVALALSLTYMGVVFAGGYLSGSLALLADAGHMFGHGIALAVALIATLVAERAKNTNFSRDYTKIEAVGGYTNGLILFVIGVILAGTAIQGLWHEFINIASSNIEHLEHSPSLHNHNTIDTPLMATVALVGLFLHGISAFVLHGGRKESLNVYALYLHLLFDVISTLIAITAAGIIHITGANMIDSVATLAISALIITSAGRMLLKSSSLLVGTLPQGLKETDISKELAQIPHIKGVHNVMLRSFGEQIHLSAHLQMEHKCISAGHWDVCRAQAERILKQKFSISYSVLQLESCECCDNKH